MSKAPSGHAVSSPADLLTIAYRIEADAVQRYTLLADQMETHNNPELLKVFRDLARAEGIHAGEIRKQAGEIDVVARSQQLGRWQKGESPEEVDLGSAHYLMTPWHALELALAGEKRALAFFISITETTKDPKIKEMAAEFVEEEAEHVNLVYQLMRRYPKPADTWAQDLDPPTSHD
jgi:rubrerythrin